MPDARQPLAEQFATLPQQAEASRLGMWAFLCSEVMFFGGLFLGYIIYRHAYPHAFAVASRETDVLYGTLNTAILLTSSLTMALAVFASKEGQFKEVRHFLIATILLAIAFLGVKALEYTDDFHKHLFPGPMFADAGEPKTQLFFMFYWMMTSLHALHVIIGIGLLSAMTVRSAKNHFSAEYHNPIEITGLYWHFVDIVWIFLYPLLYLINRHS
ncbi:MAG TPA: cytochrome c oxidase subunit 3 family protein [Verrucomicrobiae bacterium]|jgi:cytochrome c oxidase subunit 3|nr:cytochrome c oxidase subunit 3 family protein [Verrucomicrobiae bacterium]